MTSIFEFNPSLGIWANLERILKNHQLRGEKLLAKIYTSRAAQHYERCEILEIKNDYVRARFCLYGRVHYKLFLRDAITEIELIEEENSDG